MEKTAREYFIEGFQENALGKYEKLDLSKVKDLELGEFSTYFWDHSSNMEKCKQLETTVINSLNYYIKDNFLILESDFNFTKIQLDSGDFQINFNTLNLSYGAHYSLNVKNNIIEANVAFYPPRRKKEAFAYAKEFSKIVQGYLKENGLS